MTGAFALFRSSLPVAFHRGVAAELASLDAGEIGHELAILIPSVRVLLEDEAVVSEVSQMLGPGATPDGCMHVHINDRLEDGLWHPDDYCGRPWPTDRAMAILCYFPQDTPPEMGPTEAQWDGRKILASGPAGTCLLMRHDVVHRSTANRTGRPRLMLKFLFRGATSTFRDHTEGEIA